MAKSLQDVLNDSACLTCSGATTFEAATLLLWGQIAGQISGQYEADDTGTIITTDDGQKIILNL